MKCATDDCRRKARVWGTFNRKEPRIGYCGKCAAFLATFGLFAPCPGGNGTACCGDVEACAAALV